MDSNSIAKKAYGLALRRVASRETSCLEMRDYLSRKEIPKEIVEATIQELVADGSLNDERYARCLIRTLARNGKGPVQLQSALRKKGVEKTLSQVKAVLSQEVDEWNEEELAARTVARRYPNAAKDPKIYRRAYQALLRRGFTSETIRKCLGSFPGSRGT